MWLNDWLAAVGTLTEAAVVVQVTFRVAAVTPGVAPFVVQVSVGETVTALPPALVAVAALLVPS